MERDTELHTSPAYIHSVPLVANLAQTVARIRGHSRGSVEASVNLHQHVSTSMTLQSVCRTAITGTSRSWRRGCCTYSAHPKSIRSQTSPGFDGTWAASVATPPRNPAPCTSNRRKVERRLTKPSITRAGT